MRVAIFGDMPYHKRIMRYADSMVEAEPTIVFPQCVENDPMLHMKRGSVWDIVTGSKRISWQAFREY